MPWYLESRSPEDTHPNRVPVLPLPFRIGRRWDLPLALSSPSVSWEHAEIVADVADVAGQGEGLRLRDLGSRNGTFVNGRRIDEALLAEGDVLCFAVIEFRVGRVASEDELRLPTGDPWTPFPGGFAHQAQSFSQMMVERDVEVVFQPIVRLKGAAGDGAVLGFEALGRGCREGLPRSPGELFETASRLGVAAELSQLFLLQAAEMAVRHLPAGTALFANIHPAELERPEALLRIVQTVREQAPGVQLILEVHESAVAGLAFMRHLRDCLRELGVQIAYDDFGAGQSRLLELAEVPPDVLKFDGSMVRGMQEAPPARHSLLAAMLRMAADLGITTVAEGVETAGDADGCRQLGFDAAQGYFYGRPAAIPRAPSGPLR
ncbi:MAG TPA: EAL domain-containing protein [Thermoanaerobaculia bacterium]|nr:EAL domain-containing protein [Thermoanaerobaculia bacterium]